MQIDKSSLLSFLKKKEQSIRGPNFVTLVI